MNLAEFLQTVITVPQGYFCLAYRDKDKGWHEDFYDWPSQLNTITTTAEQLKVANDVYYTAYLFNEKNSKKQSCILTNHLTIQSDLDNADPKLLQYEPSVLVQTSKDRYQAYWMLSEAHYDIESLSRKMTYSIPNADRSGWSVGHKVRLPGTYNYKYGDPQSVFIVPTSLKLYDPSELDTLPEITKAAGKTDSKFITSDIPQLTIGPNELLESVKANIPLKIYSQYNVVAKDRSTALWALMCCCFRANMSRDEVLYLAYHSANNKWLSQPRELQKDVLRAEVAASDLTQDAKEIVINARKLPGATMEKHRYVLGAIQTMMADMGSFVKTHKGPLYIQKATGKPIYISSHDEALQTYLGSVYGLNATEREEQFIASGLQVYCNSMTSVTEASSLSHYDLKANTLLLHTGRRDVLRITPNFVDTITNGNGIVFDWIADSDTFAPVLDVAGTNDNVTDWSKEMFELHNMADLTEPEYMAVMRSWFLFLLFRNMSSARPVLALFGMPGSGKTTSAKRVYNLIYGSHKKISALSTFDDFDNTVSNLPFVFYDNVDTFVPWLPDRIAQSAGAIDVGKRKLYTDNDSFTIKRDAMIAVTAHNPRFLRPDVVDRLIIINLNRYAETAFVSESNLIQHILKHRNLLWGCIVRDIQKILQTPLLHEATVPMRISDYTTMGEWFAIALNYQDSFVSAMHKLRKAQKFTDLEEDQVLASALLDYATHSKHANEFRLPGALWLEINTSYTPDPGVFGRMYKNASVMSKKLGTLQVSLKDIIDIDWAPGPIRTWRIRPVSETDETV